MKPFDKGFLVGASTAAHQVEGNNVHSDCWALERIPHTAYAEPSGEAVDHYRRYEEDIKLLAGAGLAFCLRSLCAMILEPKGAVPYAVR